MEKKIYENKNIKINQIIIENYCLKNGSEVNAYDLLRLEDKLLRLEDKLISKWDVTQIVCRVLETICVLLSLALTILNL